tara:strand:+ start:244 stop:393 length:150 start_codon:yes stop_codon:yes gene_type:complete
VPENSKYEVLCGICGIESIVEVLDYDDAPSCCPMCGNDVIEVTELDGED